jgi:hypothetical protein
VNGLLFLVVKKVKGKKLSLCFLTKHGVINAYWRSSLTSALYGGEWLASRPGRFTPRERAPGTHWIGGWVGPRAVGEEKRSRPFPELEPSAIQPSVQHYTTELSRYLF